MSKPKKAVGARTNTYLMDCRGIITDHATMQSEPVLHKLAFSSDDHGETLSVTSGGKSFTMAYADVEELVSATRKARKVGLAKPGKIIPFQ